MNLLLKENCKIFDNGTNFAEWLSFLPFGHFMKWLHVDLLFFLFRSMGKVPRRYGGGISQCTEKDPQLVQTVSGRMQGQEDRRTTRRPQTLLDEMIT